MDLQTDPKYAEAPYPGLRPFRRDEADIFFGRDEQIDQLLERLDARASSSSWGNPDAASPRSFGPESSPRSMRA